MTQCAFLKVHTVPASDAQPSIRQLCRNPSPSPRVGGGQDLAHSLSCTRECTVENRLAQWPELSFLAGLDWSGKVSLCCSQRNGSLDRALLADTCVLNDELCSSGEKENECPAHLHFSLSLGWQWSKAGRYYPAVVFMLNAQKKVGCWAHSYKFIRAF